MGKFFKGKARKLKAPAYSVSVGNGAMWVDFFVDEKDARGCYLTVRDCHGTFEHRTTGFTYGFLLTAIRKGDEEPARDYAYMIYRMSGEIFQDVEFANDIIRAFNRRDERLLTEGAENAKNAEEQEEQSTQSKDEPDEGSKN